MKKSVHELVGLGDNLFKSQWPLLSLWQSLAENFYPQRADFTITRNAGSELSDNLVDSYPVLVRRDLGDSMNSLLRQGDWFQMGIQGGEPDYDGRRWLEWATKRMRQLMLTRMSGFTRATKEGDHDYTTFGNCAISTEVNGLRNGLLYRCWHLRDCAWFDDENGQVGGFVRKWNPQLKDLVAKFGDKCHKSVLEEYTKHPFKEICCYHIVIPVAMYGDEKMSQRFKFASIYIDVTNKHLMYEYGMNYMMYTVPRFQTIAGSPYAFSPATVVGLPDARTLQAMAFTLLEAGERYASPPIIATMKAIRGDINLGPNQVTYVDDEYDERLGASLRTLQQDRGGFPIGMEMREEIRNALQSAFYVNKISLPEFDRDVTAYEFSERMKQYRREVLPLIAPIESDYNGQLCENTFEVMLANGFLGSPQDIPESLRGKPVEFKFVSPISESEQEEKAARFSSMARLLSEAIQFDQDVVENVDFDTAFREAVEASKVPVQWLHNAKTVAQQRIISAQQRDIAEQSQMAAMQAEGEMAQKMAEAQ